MNEPKPAYLPIHDKESDALNELCLIVNDWANKKGWNEGIDSTTHKQEQLMLMVTELAECSEFLRKRGLEPCPHCPGLITECIEKIPGSELFRWNCPMCTRDFPGRNPDEVPCMDDHVPELTGEAAELADILIRIFHYCGKRGINLGEAVQKKHAYNITRPYRHGNKRS